MACVKRIETSRTGGRTSVVNRLAPRFGAGRDKSRRPARRAPAPRSSHGGLSGHGPGSSARRARVTARAHGLRLVGPNCLGVMVPRAGLDASFAAHPPLPGDLALISQSGAMGGVAGGSAVWWNGGTKRKGRLLGGGSRWETRRRRLRDCLDFFAADRGHPRDPASTSNRSPPPASSCPPPAPRPAPRPGRRDQVRPPRAGREGGRRPYRRARGLGRRLRRGVPPGGAPAGCSTSTSSSPPPRRWGARSPSRLAARDPQPTAAGVGVLAVDRLIDLGGRLAEVSRRRCRRWTPCCRRPGRRSNPVDIIGDADARNG